MTIPFYHRYSSEPLDERGLASTKIVENTPVSSHTCFLYRLPSARPEVPSVILTNQAKNSSSFPSITGKSPVQQQVAAFLCAGVMSVVVAVQLL